MPGSMPSPPALRSITANNAANKMIKLPMSSNRMANHLSYNKYNYYTLKNKCTCLHICLGSKLLDCHQLCVHSLL